MTDIDLPVNSSKETILQKIEENPVVIIHGGTGCGKSTQIPQFILDEGREKEKRVNIVVTQPRRIGARSIAERVCRERRWEVGSIVGYQVSAFRCVGTQTQWNTFAGSISGLTRCRE